jgi:RNA polymerase sigma-54 factor
LLLQHEQRQTVTQRIDPKIILANNILQLSTIELVQSIEAELLENPALETVDETGCAGDCLDPSLCPYCSARRNAESDEESHQNEIDMGDFGMDYERFIGTQGDPDDDYDFVGNLEAEMTLQEHLLGLLRAAVPAEDYKVGEYLVNCLNDRGWLDGTTEMIALDLQIPEEQVARVLTVIQSFDPPGVGARSLQECLLLQLCFLADEECTPETKRLNALAEQMVRDHFPLITSNRYNKLGRAVGIPMEEARLVVEYIRTRLNPYPANQFRPPWNYRPANARSAVRPDVVIRRTEIGFEIDVVGMETFGLNISSSWREMYTDIKCGRGTHTEEQRKHVVELVDRAEQFIRSLNQRRQTLRQISRSIVDEQYNFLATGSRQFLKPLTRTRIARILDIHESTVSRATANKYVQLPNQEVVSFNVFFNASLSVKDAIEQLITQEDPAQPLSDQQIVTLLGEKGINVARRTVVKYRESRKILSSTRRRR